MYTFTDHTADYGVEVVSDTPEHGFYDAALALYEIISGTKYHPVTSPDINIHVLPLHLSAEDLPDLLHTWLDWHLLRFNLYSEVPVKWEVDIDLKNNSMSGTVYMAGINETGLTVTCEIKGVTYHKLCAACRPGSTRLNYIVDV